MGTAGRPFDAMRGEAMPDRDERGGARDWSALGASLTRP
jgi:hypothetical protein